MAYVLLKHMCTLLQPVFEIIMFNRRIPGEKLHSHYTKITTNMRTETGKKALNKNILAPAIFNEALQMT